MISNEVLKIIKQRRSIRKFNDEQLKDEELQTVLEAAQYAPNAGSQAWHFTVVQNKDLLQRLNRAAKEGVKQLNFVGLRELANDERFNTFYGAPTLVLVSADTSSIPLDADCAAATQNLLLAAESIGLGSCWIYFVMFAFNSSQGPELLKELKVPEGYKPYCAAVLGYKNANPTHVSPRKPDRITYIR